VLQAHQTQAVQVQRERKKSAVEPSFSAEFAANGFRWHRAQLVFGCGRSRFQGSMVLKALFSVGNFGSYPNFWLQFQNLPNLGGRSSGRRCLATLAPVLSYLGRALMSG
jgi:hypothetical protein